MSSDSDSEELDRFALQEAVRSLQEQTAEARGLKDRVVTLTGLTSAGTAFLVGAALEGDVRDSRFHVPLGVGAALFLMLMYQGWTILRPIPDWRSAVGPTVLIEDFRGASKWGDLAGFYEAAFRRNDEHLVPLRRSMQNALLLSGAIFLCWIALIWLVR